MLLSLLYLLIGPGLTPSDSVTRSPLYSIYGETISGVTIVRAFGASSKFLRDMLKSVDTVLSQWSFEKRFWPQVLEYKPLLLDVGRCAWKYMQHSSCVFYDTLCSQQMALRPFQPLVSCYSWFDGHCDDLDVNHRCRPGWFYSRVCNDYYDWCKCCVCVTLDDVLISFVDFVYGTVVLFMTCLLDAD